MDEIKQTTTCSYCGTKDSVSVITKQSKFSRTISVKKCSNCKRQNGIKEILSRSI